MNVVRFGTSQVKDALSRRATWSLTIVVGTIINIYGQVVVPCLRGSSVTEAVELQLSVQPWLFGVSVVLGYLFPLFVSTFTAASTRAEHATIVSRAAFPDHKPDPVFRASQDGTVVEAGATTWELFRRHGVARAQEILGEEGWARLWRTHGGNGATLEPVYFGAEGAHYLVSHSRHGKEAVNVYLTRVQGCTLSGD